MSEVMGLQPDLLGTMMDSQRYGELQRFALRAFIKRFTDDQEEFTALYYSRGLRTAETIRRMAIKLIREGTQVDHMVAMRFLRSNAGE